MEASAALTIPRMFSDAAGECRFDQTDISLVMKEYAPPPRRSPSALPSQLASVSLCVSRRGLSVINTLLLKSS